MNKLLTVTLSGEAHGSLWMGGDAWKEFSHTFSPDNGPFQQEWTGLKDALGRVVDLEGGDFRGVPELRDVCITTRTHTKAGTVTRHHYLSGYNWKNYAA